MKIVKSLFLFTAVFGVSISAALAAPVLTEIIPVPALSSDNTPQATIHSTEVVDLTYSGACGNGNPAILPAGINTIITFPVLPDGTYSDCKIDGDNVGIASNQLSLTSFGIDTTAPGLDSFTSTTADGIYGPGQTVNVTATYDEVVQAGGTMTFVLDTGESVSLTNTLQGTTLTGTYTIGATASGQNSSDMTVSSISVENVSDLLGNNRTNSAVPVINIATGSAIVIDTTVPVITFNDDVSVAITNDDTIEIGVLDTNPDTTTYKYGFSLDAVCDGTDVYGTLFTSGTAFHITDELNNGKYICVISEDLAGNIAYQRSGNVLNIDAVTPTVTEKTAVVTPATDTTPEYVFTTDEGGAITYNGDCSSATNVAIIGDNMITFQALGDGIHSNCIITVTDSAGNAGIVNVSSFTIDTTAPGLDSFTSTTADGIYGPGQTVNVTATYDEVVQVGGTMTLVLDTGESVSLTNTLQGTTLIGMYTVGATASGQNSSDMTVSSISAENVSDLLGNNRTNSTVPGINIATGSAIVIDTTVPVVTEVSVVTTPTSDNTPSYTFHSTESGTIAYGGDCSSGGNATAGNNIISFDQLGEGVHSNCTITVTDAVGNTGTTLNVTLFEVDTLVPEFTSIDLINEASDGYINDAEKSFANDLVGNLVGINYDAPAKYILASFVQDCSVLVGYTIAIPQNQDIVADGEYKVCVELSDGANPNDYGSSSKIVRDTQDPLISEVTKISEYNDGVVDWTGDATPNYVFSSNEGGSISYAGDCSSVTPTTIIGNNAIDFSLLGEGAHSNCSITVTDTAGNTSSALLVSSFSVDSLVSTGTTITVGGLVHENTNDSEPDLVLTSLDGAGSGVKEMSFSCNDVTWSAWEAFALTKTDFNINTGEGCINGDGMKTIYFKTRDNVNNTTSAIASAAFRLDTTAPIFDSIGVTSDNPYDPAYAKADSELTFTVILTNADSYGGGGFVDFTIDGVAQSIPFEQIVSGDRKSTYTAKYTLAGENGEIKITGITFIDVLGHTIDLAGFTPNQVPAPTVIVDTTAPSIMAATFISSGNAGTLANHAWAIDTQTVTYTLSFNEEIIRDTLGSGSTASNITLLQKEFDRGVYGNSDSIIFVAQNGDNGSVALTNIDFKIVDRAGNVTSITKNDIQAFYANTISTDTTDPVISTISIFSNNLLDTSLAKTNDTITVSVITADNLSPTVALRSASRIFDKPVTDGISGGVGPGTMSLFTDGTELSQQIVSFKLRVTDEAGNRSNFVNTTTDGSSVRFDRTNPVVRNVRISAISQDNSAYLGDMPTYYARQGDSITLRFEATDWVDVLNGISGDFFGIPTVFQKTDPLCDGAATWCEWAATLLNVDGIEGVVGFDVLVIDNAGNGDGVTNTEVHITGTTDGSQVIFDKTTPVNPTDMEDLMGASTTSFKGGIKADFSWSNDYDPLPLAGINAGVWKYFIAFTNPDNGGEYHRGSNVNIEEEVVSLWDGIGNWTGIKRFDGTRSKLAPWTGELIPPRNITPVYYPYQLRMLAIDKAGNQSFNDFGDATQLAATQPQVAYEQPYTITIHGVVTNQNGNPIPKAVVQVVSRYGEFCNEGKEVCSTTADSLGRYSVLVNKHQDYNVTFFAEGYYVNKKDRSIVADHFELNASLHEFENIHEQQMFEPIVRLTLTNKIQLGQRWEHVYFDIYTNSGQITTHQEGDAIVINSLSTITKIRQQVPFLSDFITTADTPTTLTSSIGDITISRIGNEWRITGGGSLKHHNGVRIDFDSDQNINEYGGRLSVSLDPRNGKHGYSGDIRSERVLSGHMWTKEESLAYLDRINAGNESAVVTYTNRNGYEVFAGYRPGKLPISKTGSRYANRVRLGRTATVRNKDLSKKLQEIKKLVNVKKEKVKSQERKLTPMTRLRSTDAAKSARVKRIHLTNKIDKFARYNPNSGRAASTLKSKQYKNIHLRIGGRSVSMNKVMGRATGGY